MPISRADLILGLRLGNVLVQFEAAHDTSTLETLVRGWISELLTEGRAVASDWKEHPDLKRPYRVISQKPLPPNSFVRIL